MRKLELNEIKNRELIILNEIDHICKQESIRYSLCGGTLLGAVRHKGFIPWDDDIDIMMLRHDYEKFICYCKNNKTKFGLIDSNVNKEYGYLFSKAYDKETLIREKLMESSNLNIGVFVDIFPVDYLGDTFKEAKHILNKTRFWRELLVARNWECFKKSKTHGLIYEPVRLFFYIISRFYKKEKLINRIYRINAKYNKQRRKYSGCICGSYRNKEIMPTNVFEDYSSLLFEGTPYSVFRNFDLYLSNLYGDYMQLPSIEKRVAHHTFDCYLKEGEEV
ncbi:MAG: LicD family protein [Bacilli bacterium]|nr:LicD family protein [Bacilli bacterium]